MPSDMRRYARQTNLRLLAGFFVLLFGLGEALIWWTYGQEAALLALLCLVAGLAPIMLIAIVLWVMERIVREANE